MYSVETISIYPSYSPLWQVLSKLCTFIASFKVTCIWLYVMLHFCNQAAVRWNWNCTFIKQQRRLCMWYKLNERKGKLLLVRMLINAAVITFSYICKYDVRAHVQCYRCRWTWLSHSSVSCWIRCKKLVTLRQSVLPTISSCLHSTTTASYTWSQYVVTSAVSSAKISRHYLNSAH